MNVQKFKLEPLALHLANLSGIQTDSRITPMNRGEALLLRKKALKRSYT